MDDIGRMSQVIEILSAKIIAKLGVSKSQEEMPQRKKLSRLKQGSKSFRLWLPIEVAKCSQLHKEWYLNGPAHDVIRFFQNNSKPRQNGGK